MSKIKQYFFSLSLNCWLNSYNLTRKVFSVFPDCTLASSSSDISCAPFSNVYSFNDPDDAMLAWYNIFMPIIDKHAPLRKKRVKHPKLPPWLTKDVIVAMAIRDRLKKEKKNDDFKKQRSRVKSLVCSAKKAYF